MENEVIFLDDMKTHPIFHTEDEVIKLSSFILSLKNDDGSQRSYAYNCTLDELSNYLTLLDVQRTMRTENISDEEFEKFPKRNFELTLDKKNIQLSSFALSGETTAGKRILMTYMCTPDRLASYISHLRGGIYKKIANLLDSYQ